MRKIQNEGVDRNKLIAAYTEMWLDAETDVEREQMFSILTALTGAGQRKEQRPQQEVMKQPGPVPEKDDALDKMLQQLKEPR